MQFEIDYFNKTDLFKQCITKFEVENDKADIF